MRLERAVSLLVLIFIVSYLSASFIIIRDYGITPDEPGNFALGHKYLHYYTSGKLNIQDDIPKFEGHPNFYESYFKEHPNHYGAAANTFSAITCYIFYQKTHLLDPISAHRIATPILIAFFLYFLFYFVRRYWGNFVGLASVVALISYPRFFGHGFDNIKDVPQVIFSSLVIMVFAQWRDSKKARYLYLSFILFGIALATKIDAALAAVILILWLVPYFIRKLLRDEPMKIRMFAHIMAGLAISVALFIVFYPSLYYSQPGKIEFIAGFLRYFLRMAITPDISWNFYAPMQILYTTPVVTLSLFMAGLVWVSFNNITKNKINLLLLIWVSFPIIRHCLPGTNHYDGTRHFLIFLVPFVIIASIGARKLIEVFAKFIRIKLPILKSIFLASFLTYNVYLIVSTHPFQTTYFNCIAGGLKGAQEKGIPFSCDYWFNSYRGAGAWLQENAKKDAKYSGFPYGYLLTYYVNREDLRFIPEKDTDDREFVPSEDIFQKDISNLYFVLVPRTWWSQMAYRDISGLLSKIKEFKVVYRIKRQGGEIVTIYYKP